MMSKTSRYLLLVIVMGIFVFFAGTGVAQADCVISQGFTTKGGWTVELINSPELISPCNVEFEDYNEELVTPDECYKWTYYVEGPDGTTNGLNHINFTFPVNCKQPILMVIAEGTLQMYPEGVGDDTTGFGENIYEISVAKFTPTNITQKWSFYSTEGKMANASVGLKLGKKFEAGIVGGPSHYGDDPNAIFTVSAEEIIVTSDGKKFRITSDMDSQCIIDAWEITEGITPRQLTSIPIGQILKAFGTDWTAKMEFIGSINQKCHRAIAKSEGDNTWYYISGRYVWR